MGKIHSNSTYAKLKRAGLLDEFFMWYFERAPGYSDVAEWLSKHNMPHSDGAIYTLLRVHSVYWKVDAAQRKAAATAESLPEQTDEMIRQQLRQKEFDLAFSDLSTKEALAVLRYDMDKQSSQFQAELEKEKLKLKKEAEDRAQANLKLEREKFEEQKRRNEQAREKLTAVKNKTASGLTSETLAEIESALNLL